MNAAAEACIDGQRLLAYDGTNGPVGEMTPQLFFAPPDADVGFVLVVDADGQRWRLLGPARAVRRWRDAIDARGTRRARRKLARVNWVVAHGWPDGYNGLKEAGRG